MSETPCSKPLGYLLPSNCLLCLFFSWRTSCYLSKFLRVVISQTKSIKTLWTVLSLSAMSTCAAVCFWRLRKLWHMIAYPMLFQSCVLHVCLFCFIYELIFFNILCSMTVYLISMILYSESFYNVIVDLEVTISILSYFPGLLKV